MVNFILGTILANLAEVKKQKDTDKKKVIDYTRAARTIRDYTGDIEAAYADGILQNMPGINDEVYKLLDEYFKSGYINIYEELKELYSEELIMFIRISGLGKRRIFEIYNILGVKDLKGLKECIKDGSIYKRVLEAPSQEKGFITKTHLDRLITSLDYFESTSELYPKGYIDFFIGKLIQSISQLKDVKYVSLTGSLRRKKSFVKDIDLIVLPAFNLNSFDHERSEIFLKSLISLNFINDIKNIDSREDNISARFDTIYGIDLEVITSSASSFALDLFYTTGCKKHIKAIEDIAKNKGFYNGKRIGLPLPVGYFMQRLDLDSAESLERYIYEAMGLQFIPPELREANDEIKLASKNNLPDLIKQEDVKGDLHIHSFWSDGMMEMGELIEKAKSLNYEYIAITDHSSSNVYGNGLDAERMLQKVDFLNSQKSKTRDISLLIGGEVDIRGINKLDYDEDLLSKMDIVISSMHSNYLNTIEENTQRIISALENSYVDAMAHPTGVVFGSRAPYTLDMNRIFSAAVKYNKAMEINCYLLRLDLNDRLAREFKAMGGKFVINTDSHRIANLDMISLGIDVARRAGLTREDVLNTMPLDKLMKWRKQG